MENMRVSCRHYKYSLVIVKLKTMIRLNSTKVLHISPKLNNRMNKTRFHSLNQPFRLPKFHQTLNFFCIKIVIPVLSRVLPEIILEYQKGSFQKIWK